MPAADAVKGDVAFGGPCCGAVVWLVVVGKPTSAGTLDWRQVAFYGNWRLIGS